MFRRISNAELADLPTRWENSWVDPVKFHASVVAAWEVDQQTYLEYKAEGGFCQAYKGRFYIA